MPFVIVFFITSCKNEEPNPKEKIYQTIEENKQRVTISQGIAGTLTIQTGNCMPTTDVDRNTCFLNTLESDIWLTDTVSIFTVNRIYYNQDSTRVIDIFIHSDSVKHLLISSISTFGDGFFEITCDSGIFSIFRKDSVRLHEGVSSNSIINPVEVKPNEVTYVNLNIDLAAH